MNKEEKNTPDGAEDFRFPEEDIPESINSDIEKQRITPEERQNNINEFKALQEKAETEKELRWYEIRAQVELIVDGVGRGIDEKIKDGVTVFMALDFPTSQSCDGHGILGPWIEVTATAPDGWRESDEKKQAWREANLKEKVKMKELLEEFYVNRQVPDVVRLVLDPMGFESFRVQNAGYDQLKDVLRRNKINPKLAEVFKKEMDEFTGFLKKRYFT